MFVIFCFNYLTALYELLIMMSNIWGRKLIYGAQEQITENDTYLDERQEKHAGDKDIPVTNGAPFREDVLWEWRHSSTYHWHMF
jgi:hypothetical protein